MIKQYNGMIKSREELFGSAEADMDVSSTVASIISEVRQRGDAALLEYCHKFDRAELDCLEVTKEELELALKSVSPRLIEILKQAKENISTYHIKQLNCGFEIKKEDGVILGEKITPIEKVGIYVPGGTAAYPSTVLMDSVPAKIAGVEQLIMVTPPLPDGSIAPSILAAASIAGVDRIFKVGGAQAIAALAYGTQAIPRVYKIVGPGNAYVAEAKKQVFGYVDIDMIAGPSEILVIADAKANPSFVAADLLSQAEHDKRASAVLVTDSADLANRVATEIEEQLRLLPREEIARTSIDENGKIIIVDSLKEAVMAANEIAPEHLELCVEEPFELLPLVKNAGSVFMGRYCPESLGDYYAGTNHTLPTSGTAKFSSPLNVDDFVKKTAYTYYTQEALDKVADDIAYFADTEGLHAHARAATIRFGREG